MTDGAGQISSANVLVDVLAGKNWFTLSVVNFILHRNLAVFNPLTTIDAFKCYNWLHLL